MSTQVLKGFNDHFMEMVEDIERVFPEDNDITTVKNAFIELRRANPKMTIKVFKENIVDIYRQQIQEENIDFFINKDYKKDLGETNNSDYILNKINFLRNPVKNMELAEQKKIIKYLQNLSKLCDIYFN
tara:strand:+ start:20425 stop:20811 length:387 start_codon:yes stop_codon:yes gene_type:complete